MSKFCRNSCSQFLSKHILIKLKKVIFPSLASETKSSTGISPSALFIVDLRASTSSLCGMWRYNPTISMMHKIAVDGMWSKSFNRCKKCVPSLITDATPSTSGWIWTSRNSDTRSVAVPQLDITGPLGTFSGRMCILGNKLKRSSRGLGTTKYSTFLLEIKPLSNKGCNASLTRSKTLLKEFPWSFSQTTTSLRWLYATLQSCPTLQPQNLCLLR